MLNKNSIVVGLILGTLIPIIGFFFWKSIFGLLQAAGVMNPDGLSFTWRERTTTLLAICMNLIPFQIFKGKRFDESMRGLIFPTIFLVFSWIYYFRAALLID